MNGRAFRSGQSIQAGHHARLAELALQESFAYESFAYSSFIHPSPTEGLGNAVPARQQHLGAGRNPPKFAPPGCS